MEPSNDQETRFVLPDNSVLIQIRIDGQLLAPLIIPIDSVGTLHLLANAQIQTYASIKATEQANAKAIRAKDTI